MKEGLTQYKIDKFSKVVLKCLLSHDRALDKDEILVKTNDMSEGVRDVLTHLEGNDYIKRENPPETKQEDQSPLGIGSLMYRPFPITKYRITEKGKTIVRPDNIIYKSWIFLKKRPDFVIMTIIAASSLFFNVWQHFHR